MKKLLYRPYDLLENMKFRYIYVFGGIGFALFFLWTFEPFGIYNLDFQKKIIAISLYIGCSLLLLIIQFFLLQPLIIKNHTVLTTIVWIVISNFFIGLSGFIINAYLFNNGVFYFDRFLLFQGIILSINIISFSLIVIAYYNYLLKKKLKIANQLNKQIKNRQNKKSGNNIIIFESENKKDSFELALDSLFFITSADNYIDIHYMKGKAMHHKLIRNSLTEISTRFSNIPEIFRCHKSYIINKQKIESINGNTAGYKIKLSDYKELIPVSRTLNKSIHKLMNF